MSKLFASSAFVILLLCGCGSPPGPAADRHLLERFEAVTEESTDHRPPPERVAAAGSERLSLVTRHGVHWQAPAPDDAQGANAGGAFAFSLTVPESETAIAGGAIAGGAIAIVERTTGGGREELFRTPVEPGDWIRRRVPLAGNGGGRLVLRSEGAAVAWAEIHWLPASFGSRVRPQRPPDLVMISIDTLRSDHLSAYGYRRPTSPNLDRLARESLLFTRSLSASTWTLPSTATLLTGLLPFQHGLERLGHRLTPEVESLAERLHRHGYRTAAITDGGFVGPDWGFNQGFERYDATDGEAWGPKDVATIAAKASQWIEENRFHPYFLFVHTYETHMSYTNREGFADPFLDPAYDGRFQRAGRANPQMAADLDDSDRQRLVDLYDGEIRRADHYLGRFVERLRTSGSWQETAVVVTSDHGEEFHDHGDFDHGFGKVFDANVAVPLIVKLPGEAKGRTLDVPVSGVDVTPTLLALAGASTEGLAGRSLTELAAGAPDAEVPGRTVVVHGTNSFPKLREQRLRLDLGSITVVLDQVRRELHWYDRESDPGMRDPRTAAFQGPARTAAERLQAILAWSTEAALLARLPDDVQGVLVPRDSKVELSGAFSGLVWHPAQLGGGRWTVPLTAGQPHVLALSPSAAGRGWEILLERRGRKPEPMRLSARREAAEWHPLHDPLPEPGVLFPGSVLFQPETAELRPEHVEELKALGYL